MGKSKQSRQKSSGHKQRYQAKYSESHLTQILKIPLDSGGVVACRLIATKLSKSMLKHCDLPPNKIVSHVTESLENGARLSYDPVASDYALNLFSPPQRRGLHCYLLRAKSDITLLILKHSALIIGGHGPRQTIGAHYADYWSIHRYIDNIDKEFSAYAGHLSHRSDLQQPQSPIPVHPHPDRDKSAEHSLSLASLTHQHLSQAERKIPEASSEHTVSSPNQNVTIEHQAIAENNPEQIIWQTACQVIEDTSLEKKDSETARYINAAEHLHHYCSQLSFSQTYQIVYYHSLQCLLLRCFIQGKTYDFKLPWTTQELGNYCQQIGQTQRIWPIILPMIDLFPSLLSLICTEPQQSYLPACMMAHHDVLLRGLYRFEHHDRVIFKQVTQTLINTIAEHTDHQRSLSSVQSMGLWQYLIHQYATVDCFVSEQNQSIELDEFDHSSAKCNQPAHQAEQVISRNSRSGQGQTKSIKAIHDRSEQSASKVNEPTTHHTKTTSRIALIDKMINDDMMVCGQDQLCPAVYTWLFKQTPSEDRDGTNAITMETRNNWLAQLTRQMNRFHTPCSIAALTPYSTEYLQLCLQPSLSLSKTIQDCTRGVLKRKSKLQKRETTTRPSDLSPLQCSGIDELTLESSAVGQASVILRHDEDISLMSSQDDSLTRSAYYHACIRQSSCHDPMHMQSSRNDHQSSQTHEQPLVHHQQLEKNTSRLKDLFNDWHHHQHQLVRDGRSAEMTIMNRIVHAPSIDNGQLYFHEPAKIQWFIDKEFPGIVGFWQDPMRERIAKEWQERIQNVLSNTNSSPETIRSLHYASEICHHYLALHSHVPCASMQAQSTDLNWYVHQAVGIMITHAHLSHKNDIWAQLHNDHSWTWRQSLIDLFGQFSHAVAHQCMGTNAALLSEQLDELTVAITRSTPYVTVINQRIHRGIYVPKQLDCKEDAQQWLHEVSSQLHWIREQKTTYTVITDRTYSPLLLSDFRQACILSGYCGVMNQDGKAYQYAITCRKSPSGHVTTHKIDQSNQDDMSDLKQTVRWLTALEIMPEIRKIYSPMSLKIIFNAAQKNRYILSNTTLESAIPEIFILFSIHHNAFEETASSISILYDGSPEESVYDNQRLSLFISIWCALLREYPTLQAELVIGILTYLTGALSWDWSLELMKHWPGLLHNCYLATQSVLSQSESSSDLQRNKSLEDMVLLFHKASKKFDENSQAFVEEIRKKNTNDFEHVEVCCNNSIFLATMQYRTTKSPMHQASAKKSSSMIPDLLTTITQHALALLGLKHETAFPGSSSLSESQQVADNPSSQTIDQPQVVNPKLNHGEAIGLQPNETYHIPDLGLFADHSENGKPTPVSPEIRQNRLNFFNQEYQKLFQRSFSICIPIDSKDKTDSTLMQTVMQRAQDRADGLCHFKPQMPHDCSVCVIPKK